MNLSLSLWKLHRGTESKIREPSTKVYCGRSRLLPMHLRLLFIESRHCSMSHSHGIFHSSHAPSRRALCEMLEMMWWPHLHGIESEKPATLERSSVNARCFLFGHSIVELIRPHSDLLAGGSPSRVWVESAVIRLENIAFQQDFKREKQTLSFVKTGAILIQLFFFHFTTLSEFGPVLALTRDQR